MKARYRIRAKNPRTIIATGEVLTQPDGTPVVPYGLWDTVEHCWVDKFGRPSEDYWAYNRSVAVGRRQYLNYLAQQRESR